MFILQKIKELPTPWLVCITILLMPLSTGLGVQLTQADSLVFKHAETEINLGEIKQAIATNDELVKEQEAQIQALTEAHEKLVVSAKRKKVVLPALEEVEQAIAQTEDLTEDQRENQEHLKELIVEQN